MLFASLFTTSPYFVHPQKKHKAKDDFFRSRKSIVTMTTAPPTTMADLVDGSENPWPADKIASHGGGGEKGPNGFFRGGSSIIAGGAKIRPPSPPTSTSEEDVIDDHPPPPHSVDNNNNKYHHHHHATRATEEYPYPPPPSIHPSSVGLSSSSIIIRDGRGRGNQNLPRGIEDHGHHQQHSPPCDQPNNNVRGDNYNLSPIEQRQKRPPLLITPSHHGVKDTTDTPTPRHHPQGGVGDVIMSPSPHPPASICIGHSVRIIDHAKICILQSLIDKINASMYDDSTIFDEEDPLADGMDAFMDEIAKRKTEIASKVDDLLTDQITGLMGMFKSKVQIVDEKAATTTQPQDGSPLSNADVMVDGSPLSNADGMVNNATTSFGTPFVSDNEIYPSVEDEVERDELTDVLFDSRSCDEESTKCPASDDSGKKRKRDDVNTDDGGQLLDDEMNDNEIVAQAETQQRRVRAKPPSEMDGDTSDPETVVKGELRLS